MYITGNEPDVMIITEAIPKAQRMPIATVLLEVPGCKLYTNCYSKEVNMGSSGKRGVCVYITNCLSCAKAIIQPSSTFEAMWIGLKFVGEDRLPIGGIYMSPSGNMSASMIELGKIFRLACSSSHSHILIAGDFNTPQIEWTGVFSSEPDTHYSHELIKCIQGCFIFQHITKPTRYRVGQAPCDGS